MAEYGATATLSREGVETLKAHCWELGYDGDLYGEELSSVMGGFPDVWLEAALLTGSVPDVWAGPLAIRAYHLWVLERMRNDEREACDVVIWTHVADAYRLMVGMLDGFVVEMEDLAERLYRSPHSELDARRRAMWLEHAGDAAERRRHARERIASAERDNLHAERKRGRCSQLS